MQGHIKLTRVSGSDTHLDGISGDDRILLFETSGFILSQAEDDVK